MNEIRYDHGNIQSIAAALHEQAAALRSDAAEGARAALDAIVEESSRYTRSGDPAPIYSEVIAEARAALDVLVAKATELAAGMDRHAEILTAGVTGAQTIEAESAAAMSAVDFDIAPVNTQKPGVLTAEEREQWREQEQAAQATLPGGERWSSKVAADDGYRPLV